MYQYFLHSILARALAGAFYGILCLYLISQFIELNNVINRDKQLSKRPLTQRLITDDFYPSVLDQGQRSVPLLVDQLLQLEASEGFTSMAEAVIAQRVIQHFIQNLTSDIKSLGLPQKKLMRRAEARVFFKTIGRYINQHYIYQTSKSLSAGLIEGVLDCDMRVFLYLSLAQNLGYENFYYVLAPGHALVAWQRDDDKPLLWETTLGAGQEADLSRAELYRPAKTKIYGDYQLARPTSRLVQSQITATIAWLLSKTTDEKKQSRALDFFQKSLQQFPSANHAAALVMFGSNDLVSDMPQSAAYAEYAKVYPYTLGAQLYQLSLMVATNHKSKPTVIKQALEDANLLLDDGVIHPVLTAFFERFGTPWQQINAGLVQNISRRLGRVLYPGTHFLRPRDRVAEGRAFIVVGMWFCLSGALLMLIWHTLLKDCSLQKNFNRNSSIFRRVL